MPSHGTRVIRVVLNYCLSVDDFGDQCLFTSESDPLKGMPTAFSEQFCPQGEETSLSRGSHGNCVSLSCSHLFFQLFSQGAFGYVLPIISFILAWIETWFLDFKVLPQEAEEENSKSLSELEAG